jgi:hypothetical protein
MGLVVNVLGVLAFAAVWLWICFEVAQRRTEAAIPIVEEWAKQNGLRVTQLERRLYAAGPFTWGRTNVQCVFRVAASDQEGRERMGWVLCGHPLIGLLGDQVEVRWDEERQGPDRPRAGKP